MLDAENPIPQSLPTDSEDVELALETAQRLHRTGDYAEALKWLRRAVISADEAEDDRRQLELARASADYASIAEAMAASSKTAIIEPPPVSRPAASSPLSYSKPPPPVRSSVPPPSARESSPGASSVTQVGNRAKVADLGAADDSVIVAGVHAADETHVLATQRAELAVRDATVVTTNQPNSAQLILSPQPPRVVPQASSAVGSPATNSGSGRAEALAGIADEVSKAHGHAVAVQQGSVRVSVRVSARDANLYVVRPLQPGEAAPLGTREAYLVFDEAAVERRATTSQGFE